MNYGAYSNICVVVRPYEGICYCIAGGTCHSDSFEMKGAKITKPKYTDNLKETEDLNPNDLKLCMDLSKAIYEKNIEKSLATEIFGKYSEQSTNFDANSLGVYN